MEDQKRFMTEEQKRANFPGDYIEEAIASAASTAKTVASDESSTFVPIKSGEEVASDLVKSAISDDSNDVKYESVVVDPVTGLSTNAISTMFRMSASSDNPSFKPTLQTIHVKKLVHQETNQERYKVCCYDRYVDAQDVHFLNVFLCSFIPLHSDSSSSNQIILSDGVHYFSGMCTLRLNNLVHNGIIANNRIIKVNDFVVNTMGSGAKICIILGCQAVVGNPGYRIGAPVDISKVKSAGLQKRSVNTDDGKSEQPMKKQKSKSTPKEEKKKPAPLSIVGLKYAQASAVVGEKVTLVREPDNVSCSLTWDNSTTLYCAIYLSHEYCCIHIFSPKICRNMIPMQSRL